MRALTWKSLWFVALAIGCSSDRVAAESPPAGKTDKPAPVTAAHTSPAATPAAELGKAAPDFVLSDTDGKQVKLSSLKGKIVVLEWFNPDCPFVKHAHGKGPLTTMAKDVAGPDLVWLSINSSALGKQGHGVERNRAAKGEYGISNNVLLDENGQVGHAYGAAKTPHLFIVDKRGVLVYRGGLDNAPMGVPDPERPVPQGTKSGELVPYAKRALEDLRAGRAVGLADTPPYGCSVKYGD